MVIYDSLNNNCKIYEIKHSDKINLNQIRYLNDLEKCKAIESIYGAITNKYVLYRGNDETVNGIQYLNIEKFLINFK